MYQTPFESVDALQIFLAESSLKDFKTTLPHLSFSELAESLLLLQLQPSLESKKKLECLFQVMDSPATLEMVGKHFSVSHFLSFLELLNQYPSYQNRLSSILIRLNPVVFSQSLHLLQNNHLTYLKHEGLLEPLQYHLTQFVHEGEALQKQISQKGQQFSQHLPYIQSEELTPEELHSLIHQIDFLRDNLLDYLERLSTALSIVWHTDRVDLIEKLSSINEILQHQLIYLIGHSNFDQGSSTGLYLSLEQVLSRVFDSTLNDHDAALEGLTRLSIWHLKDYWELGLLPSIQQKEIDLHDDNEEEYQSSHQRLSFLVQQQLERLRIGTVGDLKKAYVFSKPLLKAYIHQHQHL